MTSAASKTGAAICRELLNSNANVLGIDSVSLREELGFLKEESSFIFMECKSNAAPSGAEVANTAHEHFKLDRIDWLINIVDEVENPERTSPPTGQILAVMEGKRSGLVLNVVGGSVDKGAPEETMLVC